MNKLEPFQNFKALDGYHCQSNSLAKIYAFHNYPLSEEMLFGLGAGMGFIYWHQKGTVPFLGGRGNNKAFHLDVGRRTGVDIKKISTSSAKKAEKVLIETLNRQQPVMMFVDMGFLPYFDFGEEFHFGGHTNVVCGFDGEQTLLVSDMAAADIGLKQGFTYEMTLEQLAKARGSTFKPFPPKNSSLTFDFTDYRPPAADDIVASLAQTVDQMLNPPIKNFGTQGIRKAAKEILKWESKLTEPEFRMSLLNIYIYVSVGGTGDGLFRYMYGRFLKEAAAITKVDELIHAANLLKQSGDRWANMAAPFKDALEVSNPVALLIDLPEKLNEIADKEEEAFGELKYILSNF